MNFRRPLGELYRNSPDREDGVKKKKLSQEPTTPIKTPLAHKLLTLKIGGRDSGYGSQWNPLEYFTEADRFEPRKVVIPEIASASTPFCLTPFNQSNVAAVGLQDGSVLMIRIGNGPNSGRVLGHSLQHHRNAIFDISVSHDDQYMATSSDVSIKIYDACQNKVVKEVFSKSTGSVKQVKFHPINSNIIAYSTRTGEIEVVDMRIKPDQDRLFWDTSSKRIENAHDIIVRQGRKMILRRNKVSVTCLDWASMYNIVSAGEADSTVKFWDARQMKTDTKGKAIALTTSPPSRCLSGISSLVIDHDDGKLWAMQLNNTVVSYYLHAPKLGPVDILTHPDLVTNSFYTKMSLVTPSQTNFGSYVACGGSMQLILFDKPSRDSPTKHSTKATVLRSEHFLPITCTAFQKRSGSLLTIADDSSLNIWHLVNIS